MTVNLIYNILLSAFCTKWEHNYINEIKSECLLTPIILVLFIRKHSVLSNQS